MYKQRLDEITVTRKIRSENLDKSPSHNHIRKGQILPGWQHNALKEWLVRSSSECPSKSCQDRVCPRAHDHDSSLVSDVRKCVHNPRDGTIEKREHVPPAMHLLGDHELNDNEKASQL